ncbi:aspartate 1-decarboxylase autocleavage activator PanM [Erwinia tasmaniensis]|uniref:aspartate 1-decarboxylase autocleavage activator PanM n=1 Tax=Erwinia tasmaniensis TaxID=338565 RepID=UPI003A4DA245
MKLTIIRLHHLSAQDRLDLGKIWPGTSLDALEEWLNDQHQLYAATFNERLLAAVRLTIKGTRGELEAFTVREVTRRRGVGSYLLADTLAQNPAVTQWWMADTHDTDSEIIAVFMQQGGFVRAGDGWICLRG